MNIIALCGYMIENQCFSWQMLKGILDIVFLLFYRIADILEL